MDEEKEVKALVFDDSITEIMNATKTFREKLVAVTSHFGHSGFIAMAKKACSSFMIPIGPLFNWTFCSFVDVNFNNVADPGAGQALPANVVYVTPSMI